MATRADFDKIYKNVVKLLPDLGGLASDIPRIIDTAIRKPSTASVYLRRTIGKLLQDVSSREGIIVEEPVYDLLAVAVKKENVLPTIISNKLDNIIGLLEINDNLVRTDDIFEAFESLIGFLTWQHSKYYSADEDDLVLSDEGDDSQRQDKFTYYPSGELTIYNDSERKTGSISRANIAQQLPKFSDSNDIEPTGITELNLEVPISKRQKAKTRRFTDIKENVSDVKEFTVNNKPEDDFQPAVFNSTDEDASDDDFNWDSPTGAFPNEVAEPVEMEFPDLNPEEKVKTDLDLAGSASQKLGKASKELKEKTSHDLLGSISKKPVVPDIDNTRLDTMNTGATAIEAFDKSFPADELVEEEEDYFTSSQLPPEILDAEIHENQGSSILPSAVDTTYPSKAMNADVPLTIQAPAEMSEILTEVHKPSKGPAMWAFIVIALIALGTGIIGVLVGKSYRKSNVNPNGIVAEAKQLLEDASNVRSTNSVLVISEVLAHIDEFQNENLEWAEAFKETSLSLEAMKAKLEKMKILSEEVTKLKGEIDAMLQISDLGMVGKLNNKVKAFIDKNPEVNDKLSSDYSKLSDHYFDLFIANEMASIDSMRVESEVEKASSLKSVKNMQSLYKSVGILEWFDNILKIKSNPKLDTTLTEISKSADELKNKMEFNSKVNYLIDLGKKALNGTSLEKVKNARVQINDFLITYLDNEIDVELNAVLSQLVTKEQTLKRDAGMVRLIALKKEADEVSKSIEITEIKMVLAKIRIFTEEYPEFTSDIESERLALDERIRELEYIGTNERTLFLMISEGAQVLNSTDIAEITFYIDKIKKYIKDEPGAAKSLENILLQLQQKLEDLNLHKIWREKTIKRIQDTNNAIASNSFGEIQKVKFQIQSFLDKSLPRTEEGSHYRLQLERALKKLNDKYEKMSNVIITIDSPGKDNLSTPNRLIRISGKVSNSNAKVVTVSLAGWSRDVEVKNLRYSVYMVLISGVNIITATIKTEPYVGATQRTIICTAPIAELWVQLIWEEEDTDLDLYISEPSGKTVYFANKKGDAGNLDSDNREGTAPEHYIISKQIGDKIIEGSYIIRVKYSEDRKIKRSTKSNSTIWAKELPNPRPVSFRLVIFKKGVYEADFEGKISRMDYVHNGKKAWLAYPPAWWQNSYRVVLSK